MLRRPTILLIPSIDWIGGPENRLHRIVREWNTKASVHVFWFPLTGRERRHADRILLKPFTISSNNVILFYILNIIPHAFFIVRALLQEKYSLVLVSHPFYGIPATIAAKIKKIPLIFDLQDDLPGLARTYSTSSFARIISSATFVATFFVIANSDVTTTVSGTLANFARRFNSHVLLVPNGVELQSFVKKEESARVWPQLVILQR